MGIGHGELGMGELGIGNNEEGPGTGGTPSASLRPYLSTVNCQLLTD
ncbi:MAG: hypothetical protein HC894_28045 [Microcoleus sp. SM1_3_4]|nr:hypothetical protein [Microcoleus sp. SM1_3_4]